MASQAPQPCRLHRRRAKGARLDVDSREANGLEVVCVSRPSVFGNPFDFQVLGRRAAVTLFEAWVEGEATTGDAAYDARERRRLLAALPRLIGRNVACWCPPGASCHGDVLLKYVTPGGGW